MDFLLPFYILESFCLHEYPFYPSFMKKVVKENHFVAIGDEVSYNFYNCLTFNGSICTLIIFN